LRRAELVIEQRFEGGEDGVAMVNLGAAAADLMGHLAEVHGDFGAMDEAGLLDDLEALADRRQDLLDSLICIPTDSRRGRDVS
jgi:hypothetical protein